MRAVVIDRFGGPEELRLTERPQPLPDAGQVLVRVAAAGVNPIDYKMRDGSSGAVRDWTEHDFPAILGREAVGVIEEVGPAVISLSPGDRVFGMAPHALRTGCYAEFVALPEEALALAPDGVPDAVLGATALAGLTAWAAVHDEGRVQAADTVLIHGAGGGVGHLAVQLALAAGAEVFASASAWHHERLRAYGAQPVDYRAADVTEVTPRPDVIIDGVYFGTYEPSMDHLAHGGRLVILPTLADLDPARDRGIDVSVPRLEPDPERLAELGARIASGALHVEVSDELPLDSAAEAHRILESGHAPGKLVLIP